MLEGFILVKYIFVFIATRVQPYTVHNSLSTLNTVPKLWYGTADIISMGKRSSTLLKMRPAGLISFFGTHWLGVLPLGKAISSIKGSPGGHLGIYGGIPMVAIASQDWTMEVNNITHHTCIQFITNKNSDKFLNLQDWNSLVFSLKVFVEKLDLINRKVINN